MVVIEAWEGISPRISISLSVRVLILKIMALSLFQVRRGRIHAARHALLRAYRRWQSRRRTIGKAAHDKARGIACWCAIRMAQEWRRWRAVVQDFAAQASVDYFLLHCLVAPVLASTPHSFSYSYRSSPDRRCFVVTRYLSMGVASCGLAFVHGHTVHRERRLTGLHTTLLGGHVSDAHYR